MRDWTRRVCRVGRVSGLGLLIAVLAVGCGPSLPEVDGDLAFVGVNVLPMTGRGGPVVLENQTVVVDGRRIVASEPTADVAVTDGVRLVEAEGQYLMPGLAEMHGHLLGRPLLPADIQNLLFLYVANGVTTVRGMQGDRSHFRLRDQIARGETIGPRLFRSSPSLNGAHVTSPKVGAQLTREYEQRGYDLVKMPEGLSLESFDAVADMAREVGIPFGGHVPDEVGLLRALEAGQVSIDHLDNYIQALVPEDLRPAESVGLFGVGELLPFVDEGRLPELVEATRTAGAWVVPTMVLWETAFFGAWSSAELRGERPELRFVPPELVIEWSQAIDGRLAGTDRVANRGIRELRRTILRALVDGGVRILLGTDSPQIFSVPGFSLHHEMALWVENGMTPYEVLETGTRRVAEYYDATDDFGSVEVGLRADLLLLTANPIENIDNVAKRAGVMLNGRWFPETHIQQRLAEMATFYGHWTAPLQPRTHANP